MGIFCSSLEQPTGYFFKTLLSCTNTNCLTGVISFTKAHTRLSYVRRCAQLRPSLLRQRSGRTAAGEPHGMKIIFSSASSSSFGCLSGPCWPVLISIIVSGTKLLASIEMCMLWCRLIPSYDSSKGVVFKEMIKFACWCAYREWPHIEDAGG